METNTSPLPGLDQGQWQHARAAMHGYSRVLGALRSEHSPRQKHWWHASLSVHTRGLTTGPVHTTAGALELRLDFLDGHAALLDSQGRAERWYLTALSPAKLATLVSSTTAEWGKTVDLDAGRFGEIQLGEGALRDARALFSAILWFDGLLKAFKARQKQETSPVQLWPHHFDLALLYLTGRQVPDHDPVDEESADEQLNFGFSPGSGDERPYFYATCYPPVDDFPGIELPVFAGWNHEGWQGVRVDYDGLRRIADPYGSLFELLEMLRSQAETALG